MSIDIITLQKWLAGTEIKFKKQSTPFSGVWGLNKIESIKNYTNDYQHAEKIDLTRASDFHIQESEEDLLVASISLPVFGKKGFGNDIGIAVASFTYTDSEGDTHKVLGFCAYAIAGIPGVTEKIRDLRKSIAIPLK